MGREIGFHGDTSNVNVNNPNHAPTVEEVLSRFEPVQERQIGKK